MDRDSREMNDYETKIRKMAELEKDWDTYGADPPSDKSIEQACHIVSVAESWNFPPVHVCPSAQGGIGICWNNIRLYSDIEVLNDGEILAVTSDGKGGADSIKVWSVDIANLQDSLSRIQSFLNQS